MSGNKKIAFQGVKGAHSDLACRKVYPYLDSVAYPTFGKAIEAVENGDADLCMIPIENSNAGRVSEIHNLLPETSLSIVGEHFMRIEHSLMAPKGTKIEDIKTVYSHPQALMQCSKNVDKLNLQVESYANTAIAARDIKEWNDKSKAAIASRLAAEIYDLDILEESFEDDKDNTTVFIAMGREPIDIPADTERVITSLIFVARNIPAALYKALGGFASNQVNMLKIESYIPAGNSKTAEFFISFEGSPEDRNVQLAIEELGFFCKKVKVLGVYPAAPERQ